MKLVSDLTNQELHNIAVEMHELHQQEAPMLQPRSELLEELMGDDKSYNRFYIIDVQVGSELKSRFIDGSFDINF